MKVILAAADSKYIHSNLALRYIREHLRASGYDPYLYETTVNDDAERVTEDLVSLRGDVYVFSVYIWNVEFTEKIVSNLKKVMKDITVVMGGPEVTFGAEDALGRIGADIVMEGEGELLSCELMDVLSENYGKKSDMKTGLDRVRGLYFKDSSGKTVYTGRRNPPSMDDVIFPYTSYDIEELGNRIIYYEAQRGCPWRCSYCLSGRDKNLRKRDIEKVFSEISFFIENRVKLVKFVDRTFNMDREYSYRIFEFIRNKKLQLGDDMVTCFHFEVSASLIGDDLLELLSSIPEKLIQLEAGIQSTDKEVLNNVNRFDDFEKIREVIVRIISYGNIHVHTDLIAGLPGDTMKTFSESFERAMEMRPHMLQVGFLKVLKGTQVYEETDRYGMEVRNYPPYEVLKTSGLSYENMSQIKRIEKMVDIYWNSGKYSTFMNYLFNKCHNKYELFLNMAELFTEKYSGKGKIKEEEYYRFGTDFACSLFPDDSGVFIDLLRFDHLLRDRSGWFPYILKGPVYNSRKLSVSGQGGISKKLKGTVAGFKIRMDTKEKDSTYFPGETYIWYSMQTDRIFEVYEFQGDFIIKNPE